MPAEFVREEVLVRTIRVGFLIERAPFFLRRLEIREQRQVGVLRPLVRTNGVPERNDAAPASQKEQADNWKNHLWRDELQLRQQRPKEAEDEDEDRNREVHGRRNLLPAVELPLVAVEEELQIHEPAGDLPSGG
jgi:hypothetical protein